MHKQPDNDADAQAIFRKAVAKIKSMSKYVFDENLHKSKDEKGQSYWIISVYTDITRAAIDEIEEVITKSKRGMLLGRGQEFGGEFDWASDTYIKPSVMVLFHF